MARTSVRITGVNSSVMQLNRLTAGMEQGIANTTETYARKIANEAADAAPELNGLLKNSIETSPTQVGPNTWELGSDLPYATRQEYEHATKKGFMRNSIDSNRDPYYSALERITQGG